MKHFILILSFFTLLFAKGQAQTFDKFMVWVDTQQVDGKRTFVGWLRNNSTTPAYIKYISVLKLKGQAAKTIRGTTLTLPNSPTLLTRAIFTLEEGTFEQLHLTVVNNNDDILASAKISAPPPSQKLPPAFRPKKTDTPTGKKNTRNRFNDIEIDGLVLDETRSKMARDFYELFYKNWDAARLKTKSFIIIIREAPSRIGIGTSIIVEVDGKQVSRLNLQPRAEVMENMAGQLVAALENYLNDPSNRSNIDGDDLIGSGIY
ncbi:MAG TPA: hypothetical protein ENJ95_01070 [Bacteroidetes bacterium]|nr:hypothetical protein [Bacteroidota bacterium]